MTKSEIISRLSRDHQIDIKLAAKIVNMVFDEILDLTINHGKLELRGFGNFKLKKKNGRFIKNPKTGVEMYIESRYTIVFKPSKILIRKINGKV